LCGGAAIEVAALEAPAGAAAPGPVYPGANVLPPPAAERRHTIWAARGLVVLVLVAIGVAGVAGYRLIVDQPASVPTSMRKYVGGAGEPWQTEAFTLRMPSGFKARTGAFEMAGSTVDSRYAYVQSDDTILMAVTGAMNARLTSKALDNVAKFADGVRGSVEMGTGGNLVVTSVRNHTWHGFPSYDATWNDKNEHLRAKVTFMGSRFVILAVMSSANPDKVLKTLADSFQPA
jgi:hypothetical protein